MIEPELITIVEGPTPDFRPTSSFFFPSIMEGPDEAETFMCELRNMNGKSILELCQRAWKQDRPVHLLYKDEMLMEQTVDVVAIRLKEISEGTVLYLWLRAYLEYEVEEVDEGEGDVDDGFDPFSF